MRVMIDSNVIMSAILNQKGTPYQAYIKATTYPVQGMICEKTINELLRAFQRKFPDRLESLEKFLSLALEVIEVVPVSDDEYAVEANVRDKDDRFILRAAIDANADVLVTGDKDFLESGIGHPIILTPAEFVRMEN